MRTFESPMKLFTHPVSTSTSGCAYSDMAFPMEGRKE
jgi:hypothetical protein